MRIKIFFFVILFLILSFLGYLFLGKSIPAEKITWGVNFSQKQAGDLGLDWQKTYLALLDDLGAKNIKLATYWDLIEAESGNYDFSGLDWQIQEAEGRGVKIILVLGMRTPRWPECHIPDWAKNLSKEGQQKEILELIEKIILRYKENNSIWAWQVENEPFFPFGECPWVDKVFLKKEIKLVKELDTKKRQILISDSGEGSFWIKAAQFGDIVGTTMYKKVWFRQIGFYFSYPFPPAFYGQKAKIIKKIFDKDVICVEFQAEPWGPKPVYELPLEEQQKTMSLEKFKYNIDFAKKTGLNKFYLWGGEWWYWMKERQGRPEIWDEVKKLFNP